MNYSFPHPVLGYSNLVKGEFLPKIDRELNNDILKIDVVELNIKNDYFSELIFNKKIADVFIKVQCKSTLKCWSFKIDIEKKNNQFSIKTKDIRHYIEINFLIIANQKFTEYFDKKTFDEDYSDSNVFPESDDIIGVSSIFKIHLINEFRSDNSEPIFIYEPRKGINHFEYEDNEDNIKIIYPGNNNDEKIILKKMSNMSLSNFIVAVIYPSLLKCLSDICHLEESEREIKAENSIWFNTFEEVVGTNKLTQENIEELSWKFLNHMYQEENNNKFIWNQSFKEIEKLYES